MLLPLLLSKWNPRYCYQHYQIICNCVVFALHQQHRQLQQQRQREQLTLTAITVQRK